MKKRVSRQGFRSDLAKTNKFSHLFTKQKRVNERPYVPRKYKDGMFVRVDANNGYAFASSGAEIDGKIISVAEEKMSYVELKNTMQKEIDRIDAAHPNLIS